MKIKKLVLNNFRQFYGETTIEFSTDNENNISVIHGENGGGKTSLLNAFKWALYEVTDLDTGDRKLLNQQAEIETKNGENVDLSVLVEFEHEKIIYNAKRTQIFLKGDNGSERQGSAVLELSWIDPNPNKGFQTSDNPEVRIKQLLPKDLHVYFFFHGERIEQLVLDSDEKIKEAIKSLMGISVVERAYDHLSGPVMKHFNRELKEQSSSRDKELLDRIQDLEEEYSQLTKQEETYQHNINEARTEIALIDDKIKQNKPTEELQEKRSETTQRIKDNNLEIDELEKKKRSLINDRGMLALIRNEATLVYNVLEDRRKKGELPFKIKKQFIEDLLDQEKCICGTALKQGTSAFKEIEKYLLKATSSDLEGVFITTSAALKSVDSESEILIRDLKEVINKISDYKEKNRGLHEILDTISEKIKSTDNESIQELEIRRKALNDKILSWATLKGGVTVKKTGNREQHSKVESELNLEQAKSSKEAVARDRYHLTEAAKDYLYKLILAFTDQLRIKLSDQVKETVSKILKNEYLARIDENFMIRFDHQTPIGEIEVPELSSGQKVVAGLSFIASIISIAKKRYLDEKNRDYFPGGLYPLVMDTPFGNADDEHSENIARYIPELADQVIIFSSNKNWSPAVQKICKSRIGKEYSIIHYSVNPKEGVNPNYERKSSTGYEFSIIEEGFYGR